MEPIRRLFIYVWILVLVQTAFADDRTSSRSVGMGRTAVAVSRGTDAIGINPANIAIPDIGTFNFSLMNTAGRISTELMSYELYQKYFTGRDSIDSQGKTSRVPVLLTQQDKDLISDQMPENGTTRMNVESMLGGISLETALLGGIGFAIIEHAGIKNSFTRDFFDLAYLQGLPSNAKYNFDGTSFEGWWYREFDLSYGRKLPVKIRYLKNLYAGAAVKLVRGYGIFQTTKNNGSIENRTALSDTGTNSILGNFDFAAERAGADFFHTNDNTKQSFTPGTFFSSTPVGKGTGFDFGITAEYYNGFIVGLSVTDIGRITWDKNVLQTTGGGQITFNGYTKEIVDSIKSIMKGKNSPGGAFVTNLPTVFRIGVDAQSDKVRFLKFLPGRLSISVEYAQGFNESLGNTTKPRLSLGTEYRIIPLIPLRTGVMMGGDDRVRWAFGFGLDFRIVDLDVATDNFGMFFSPKSFNAVSVGFGLKVRV